MLVKHLFRFTICALAAALCCFPGSSFAQPNNPNDDALSATQVREDLAYLYATMGEGHYDLYAYRDRAAYDAFYTGLLEQIDEPLNRAQVAALLQRFLAFGRIGHASTDAPGQEFLAHLGRGGTFVPLFARIECDGRVLLTRTVDAAGLASAGSELVAIGGEPAVRYLSRLGDLISAERTYMMHARIEDLLPILLWPDRGAGEPLTVTLRIEGQIRKVSLPAVTMAEFGAIRQAHPTAEPVIDFVTREARIIDGGVAYLRPGPFGALPDEDDNALSHFTQFVDKSFAEFAFAGAMDLILDLRNNPGGDNGFSDPMIAWLADRPFRFASRFDLKASAPTKAHYEELTKAGMPDDPTLARLILAEREQANGTRYPFEIDLVAPRSGQRFKGHVWALVNRHSYSNAATVAAIIQDYGFGTIIGEETADLPTSFASIVHFSLPNSGFSIAYPKSYFIRPNGDERLRGVVPDVELPRQPVSSSEDTMLLGALAAIKRSRAGN